jgi:hypothetical protein
VRRRAWPIVFGVFAFVLLSAGDCEIGDLGALLNKPGRIVVSNAGTVPAVVTIVAPDVKSYPTLAGGASASVQTNVGGTYDVRVVMTPENASAYRAKLTELRGNVERLISGSLSPVEKTRLFLDLAGIKAAILAFENSGNAAGCSGQIKLGQDEQASVNATVTWVETSGGGFWDSTCSSNN